MTYLAIPAYVLLVVTLVFLVKHINKTYYWRSVATGEIDDPVAHIECHKEIAEAEVRLRYAQNEIERLNRKNAALEKVFTEKVQPAVDGAAAELAAWIKEEEEEMRQKAK